MTLSNETEKPALCFSINTDIAYEPSLPNKYEIHKSRYLNEQSSLQDRNASAQWLVDHGFIGLGGKMIVTNRKVVR